MRVLSDSLLVARAQVATDPAVAALTAGRVWANRLPPSPTFPAVRLQRITGTVVDEDAAFEASRVQADCWGAELHDDRGAFRLSSAVHAALRSMRDVDHPTEGRVVEVRTEVGPQWLPDETVNRARYVLDVRIWLVPRRTA